MSKLTTLAAILLVVLSSLACGDAPEIESGSWYEDVGAQAAEPRGVELSPGSLDPATPLEDDGQIRYTPLGHALVPVPRTILEGRGAREGTPVTRMGLIQLHGEELGLDLVDWRRKDAKDLLKIRRDLAAVIHLDPKQICDDRLRHAIREAAPEVLSLSFAPGPRVPSKIPGCLAALDGGALHLMVPAADGPLVAGLAGLAGLETLILRAPALDADAMTALGRASALRTLDLGAAQVGTGEIARLASMAALESLSLFGTLIEDASLAHLPNPRGLRVLDLGFTEVGDAGLSRIAELSALRVLGLWHTGVTDQGIGALRPLEHLVALDLTGTAIGDEGVAQLVHHAGLRRLDLTGTAVTDAGLAALTALQDLEELRLGGTGVTDGGLLSLAAFPRLRLLDLRSAAVTGGAVEALRRARPEMDIRDGR